MGAFLAPGWGVHIAMGGCLGRWGVTTVWWAGRSMIYIALPNPGRKVFVAVNSVAGQRGHLKQAIQMVCEDEMLLAGCPDKI